MAKIDHLVVKVEPWAEHHGMTKVRIEIQTDFSEKLRIDKIIPDDDFVPAFDYIWQKIGLQIKEHFQMESTS